MSVSLLCRSMRVIAEWKLDGGQAPGPRLSRHLGQCPHCREWLALQVNVCKVVGQSVASARDDWAGTPLSPFRSAFSSSSRPISNEAFPWGRLLTLSGACAAVLAAIAIWQPWQSDMPASSRPLEQWQVAFQETLKKAQEPTALEKEFQATLNDAERAMTAVARGVASHDLIAGWSGGN